MKKVSFNIFDFSELSDEVKDKVWKRDFVDSALLSRLFHSEVKNDLKYNLRYSDFSLILYNTDSGLCCNIYGNLSVNDLICLVSDELTEEEYYRAILKDNYHKIYFSLGSDCKWTSSENFLKSDYYRILRSFFCEKEDKLVSLICTKMYSICKDIANHYSQRLIRDDNFASNYFYKNDIMFYEDGEVFDLSNFRDRHINVTIEVDDIYEDDVWDRFN